MEQTVEEVIETVRLARVSLENSLIDLYRLNNSAIKSPNMVAFCAAALAWMERTDAGTLNIPGDLQPSLDDYLDLPPLPSVEPVAAPVAAAVGLPADSSSDQNPPRVLASLENLQPPQRPKPPQPQQQQQQQPQQQPQQTQELPN